MPYVLRAAYTRLWLPDAMDALRRRRRAPVVQRHPSATLRTVRWCRALPCLTLCAAVGGCQPGVVNLDSDGVPPFGPVASAVWIDMTTGADLALAPLADDVHALVISTAPGFCEQLPDVVNRCAAALTELKKTPDLCAEGGDRFGDLAEALSPLAGADMQQIGIGLHNNTGPLRPPVSEEHRAVMAFSGLVAEPVFTLTALAHQAPPFASLAADWDAASCGSPRSSAAAAAVRDAESGALLLELDAELITASLVEAALTDGARRRGTAAFEATFRHCPITIATIEQRNCVLMLALGPRPTNLVPPPAVNDGPLCLEALFAFQDAQERCLAIDQAPDVWFNAAACQGAPDDGFDNRAFYRCLIKQLTQDDRDAICEASGFGDVVIEFEDRSVDDDPPGCRELFGVTPG